LGLVHVVCWPRVRPVAGRLDRQAALALGQLRPALRPLDLGAHVVLAAAVLARIAEELRPTRVLVDHREMIVDVAVVRPREHLPETTDRPFVFASAQVARTERTPGASTATGFSAKTCLPASTAALRCSGRKCGGVQSSTTSQRAMTSL